MWSELGESLLFECKSDRAEYHRKKEKNKLNERERIEKQISNIDRCNYLGTKSDSFEQNEKQLSTILRQRLVEKQD